MTGLRERRKEETRRALEGAALRLFARDGFDGTTIEAIAAEAEVSVRTFFRYYAAKEDVLNPMRAVRQERLREELLGVPVTGEEDLLTIAVDGLCRIVPDFEAERDLGLLLARAAATSGVLRGRLYDVLRTWESTIAAALAQRAGTTIETPAVVAASATAVTLWQHAFERWLGSDGSGLEEQLRALHDALR